MQPESYAPHSFAFANSNRCCPFAIAICTSKHKIIQCVRSIVTAWDYMIQCSNPNPNGLALLIFVNDVICFYLAARN